MTIDEQIEAAEKEMYDAEDALIASGFSEEQWRLIRAYILHAHLSIQLKTAKSLTDIGKQELQTVNT